MNFSSLSVSIPLPRQSHRDILMSLPYQSHKRGEILNFVENILPTNS